MAEVRVKIPRLRLIKGRFYWWPTPAVQALGFASEALGADPIKAAERATALNAQVDGERRDVKEPSVEPETVAALIRLYRSDAAFTALRKTTQRGYGNVLDQIEAKEGKVAVRSITKKQLKAVYRELLTRGVAVAGLHMRIWRLLLSFAEDEGWIESNPGKKLRIASTPSRTALWTWEQVKTFCDAADAEGAPSMALAVMLAYDLGQRQGDVLALTKSARKGNTFSLRQSKQGEPVKVPLRWPETKRRLSEAPKTDATQVIVCETTGRPYRPDHFRHEFSRIRNLAGLPKALQFRDLRRTAATEIGDGGATDDQIRAVTGHRSRNVVAVYVRPTGTQAAAAQKGRKRTKGQPK
jgi:integrase